MEGYIEITNEHGFPQTVCSDDYSPACSQCFSAVLPNRGQGTACDICQDAIMRECMHDYDTGCL
jgi:hypothetical protein